MNDIRIEELSIRFPVKGGCVKAADRICTTFRPGHFPSNCMSY